MSAPKKAKDDEKKSDAMRDDIVHNKTFNLAAYIKPYTGYGKQKRLLYIGEKCAELSLDAFLSLLTDLKSTLNVNTYTEVVSIARQMHGETLGDDVFDQKFIASATNTARSKNQNFELTTTNHKRDGDKDVIRKSMHEFAELLIQCGDYAGANNKYCEVRDNNWDTLETLIGIIKTSIFSETFADVKTTVSRAQQFYNPQLQKNKGYQAVIQASLGLQALKAQKYREAAQCFLNVTVDLSGNFDDVLTPRDAATYGCVCALATYNRHELTNEILNNSAYRPMLELVPGLRKVVSDFISSKYTTCLQGFDKLKPDLMLDFFLGPHLGRLYAKLRDKALVQYFKPFTSVKLTSMAQAFALELNELEKLLKELIADQKIQARIDSHNKVLLARHSDERSGTFDQALVIGNKYARDVKSLLLRLSIVQHDFVVRPPPRTGMDKSMGGDDMKSDSKQGSDKL